MAGPHRWTSNNEIPWSSSTSWDQAHRRKPRSRLPASSDRDHAHDHSRDRKRASRAAATAGGRSTSRSERSTRSKSAPANAGTRCTRRRPRGPGSPEFQAGAHRGEWRCWFLGERDRELTVTSWGISEAEMAVVPTLVTSKRIEVSRGCLHGTCLATRGVALEVVGGRRCRPSSTLSPRDTKGIRVAIFRGGVFQPCCNRLLQSVSVRFRVGERIGCFSGALCGAIGAHL